MDRKERRNISLLNQSMDWKKKKKLRTHFVQSIEPRFFRKVKIELWLVLIFTKKCFYYVLCSHSKNSWLIYSVYYLFYINYNYAITNFLSVRIHDPLRVCRDIAHYYYYFFHHFNDFLFKQKRGRGYFVIFVISLVLFILFFFS